MGDLQRQALARDIARRLQLASHDEVRVVDAVLGRLELGRERYGELDLAKPRDWGKERHEELLDAIVYEVAGELAAQDRERAELHEAAQREMLGEFAPDRHRTRVSNEPARIALADIDDREPYASVEIDDLGGGRG